MKRGGEVVAQMEAETLLAVEDLQSCKVATTKGQSRVASMASDMGVFSGIAAQRQSVVFNPTRIREICKRW